MEEELQSAMQDKKLTPTIRAVCSILNTFWVKCFAEMANRRGAAPAKDSVLLASADLAVLSG